MTTRPVRDDVLESVLLGRAGDGAPADLRATILAAVTADTGRTVRRSWPRRHPWRLLAVAAVLLTTVGTAVLVGTPHKAVDPRPSQLAVVPRLSPTPAVTASPPPSAGP